MQVPFCGGSNIVLGVPPPLALLSLLIEYAKNRQEPPSPDRLFCVQARDFSPLPHVLPLSFPSVVESINSRADFPLNSSI